MSSYSQVNNAIIESSVEKHTVELCLCVIGVRT